MTKLLATQNSKLKLSTTISPLFSQLTTPARWRPRVKSLMTSVKQLQLAAAMLISIPMLSIRLSNNSAIKHPVDLITFPHFSSRKHRFIWPTHCPNCSPNLFKLDSFLIFGSMPMLLQSSRRVVPQTQPTTDLFHLLAPVQNSWKP